MERKLLEEPTYVLFGSEAIHMYSLSLRMLLSCTQLEYKVAAYEKVSNFVEESKKWDGFIEINEKDYIQLKNHLSKTPPLTVSKKHKSNKKPTFFNFFK